MVRTRRRTHSHARRAAAGYSRCAEGPPRNESPGHDGDVTRCGRDAGPALGAAGVAVGGAGRGAVPCSEPGPRQALRPQHTGAPRPGQRVEWSSACLHRGLAARARPCPAVWLRSALRQLLRRGPPVQRRARQLRKSQQPGANQLLALQSRVRARACALLVCLCVD